MEKSVKSMLNRRASLLHKHNESVPSQHEAVSHLGNLLGQTVLKEMSPMAKKMMDIDTPFPVAPKTLWISPNDRTDGEILLKPPPNGDVIKALTHEGILEIGSTLEERMEKQIQSRIRAARKEVEDFERFECNNRIKFALEQEKLAHEEALKEQRNELLSIFQKDRDELMENSKIEIESVKTDMISEHIKEKEKAVQSSVEQIQHSTNDKISELIDRIAFLENENKIGKKTINDEVEKRKAQDWKILHEMFIEIHKQFTRKLISLQNSHNAEIRQIYLEYKTIAESDKSTQDYNEDDSIWDDESLSTECEQEKIELQAPAKPFVISLCKVEGESSGDEPTPKLHTHSTGSSFKCYKHRSKTTKNTYPKNFIEEKFTHHTSGGSKICNADTNSLTDIKHPNKIDTTDISCDILRRLGLNFYVSNIAKVKEELDNLLLKFNSRGDSRLLTATDSLDLITEVVTPAQPAQPAHPAPVLLIGIQDSRILHMKKSEDIGMVEEYKRIITRRKSQKVIDSRLTIPLTVEEYMETLTPVPRYMESTNGSISIWDYKTMSDQEWNDLIQEIDNKHRTDSTETTSKKTVTMTCPNSMESLLVSAKCASSNPLKPIRGILRPSIENKTEAELLSRDEVFQTDEVQFLVNKFAQ